MAYLILLSDEVAITPNRINRNNNRNDEELFLCTTSSPLESSAPLPTAATMPLVVEEIYLLQKFAHI